LETKEKSPPQGEETSKRRNLMMLISLRLDDRDLEKLDEL
jgi:hypothetical protein